MDANRLPADLNTQPSSFFVSQMPSSKRKSRRKAADLHEISEPDLPESSPSRPSPKKRKVIHLNGVLGTANVRLTAKLPRSTVDDLHRSAEPCPRRLHLKTYTKTLKMRARQYQIAILLTP